MLVERHGRNGFLETQFLRGHHPVSPVGESPIPRDGSYVVIDAADTPTDSSTNTNWARRGSLRSQDAFGMLKKRKKRE